ncbi:MAG: amino acid ABC transporter permease [Acidobacteria bacterium]|nr:amino acid ABC transporter permease [Acidobacteriota bacterium]
MSSTLSEGEASLEVVPLRHWGRLGGALVTLVGVAMLIHTVFSKIPSRTGQVACHVVNATKSCHPVMEWRFSWNTVGSYLFDPLVMNGLWLTLQITFWAMLIGITLGLVIAMMRLSHNRLMTGISWFYTWFFRGTPVYIQILFWFAISYLYPTLSVGVPFGSWAFLHINSVTLFTPLIAGITALGLNEAAYFSEIARAGLISVDEGQIEAATSIGMTPSQTMRMVILPQAMRVIIPPTGNEVISMLKTTSLVASIGVIELTGAVDEISASNFKTVPLLLVACVWYLLCTTILSVGQFYVERYYARGSLRTQPPTPIQRLRGDLGALGTRFRRRSPVVSR